MQRRPAEFADRQPSIADAENGFVRFALSAHLQTPPAGDDVMVLAGRTWRVPFAGKLPAASIALVLFGASAFAQEPPHTDPGPLTPPRLPPAYPATPSDQPPYFQHTPYGALSQPALPHAPAAGHDTYAAPIRHYGVWFRPAAFAEDAGDNCQDRPWAPRGYGVPHRNTCERMDYSPYRLTTFPSVHGPSYYARRPMRPCCECYHK